MDANGELAPIGDRQRDTVPQAQRGQIHGAANQLGYYTRSSTSPAPNETPTNAATIARDKQVRGQQGPKLIKNLIFLASLIYSL